MAARRKTGKKRAIVILIILILLLALGAGAYYLWTERGGGLRADGTAYVQSVAEITGQSGAMLAGRYSGIIEAKEIVKVKLDQDKALDECFVEVGDKVTVGAPLFSYDVDALSLTYEQLKLELEAKTNNIETMKGQVIDLEAQLKKARTSQKPQLTIELNTLQLNLRKEEYEAAKKQLEVDKAETVINDNVVKSETAGTVRSITPPSAEGGMSMDGTTDDAFITIVSGDDYRVKGTISEQSVFQLMTGMPVIIRSRVNEKQTWVGAIDLINTEEPVTNQNQMYYGNTGEQASKYAFYVALDTADGLMMGQHVYIELDVGQDDAAGALMLPEYYLLIEGDRYYVYAASKQDRIEKREIAVGMYDEALGAYAVESGLTFADRIAFPDETVSPGMAAADAGYAGENGGTFEDGGLSMGVAPIG